MLSGMVLLVMEARWARESVSAILALLLAAVVVFTFMTECPWLECPSVLPSLRRLISRRRFSTSA